METCNKHPGFLLLPLLLFLMNLSLFNIANTESPTKPGASAVLVFGDSTVDPGNNNYVNTISKANFPPYGIDFPNQEPTGRFTDGRLTTDFIASYLGVKDYVPPYLDPTLGVEELMTGVSFASAGSGFDPLTPRITNVIDIPRQTKYFKEYKERLESAIGKERTENHIKDALFLVSAGTNDFVVNYFTLPTRRKTFTVSEYRQFVLQKAKLFIQDLIALGARRIGVTGLPPIGCLPVVITLFSKDYKRECIDYFSSVAREFNFMLQNELNMMQIQYANIGARIYLLDAYGPLDDMIQGLGSYAFEKVNSGCCGTGYLETALLCNPKSYVCPDPSKYVFWDSIHPTEKTYYNIYKAVLPTIDLIVGD